MGKGGRNEKPPNTVVNIAEARRAKEARNQQDARQNEDRVQDFVNNARNLIKLLDFLKLDKGLVPSVDESERARIVALEMTRTQLEMVLAEQQRTGGPANPTSEKVADIEAAAAAYIKRFGKAQSTVKREPGPYEDTRPLDTIATEIVAKYGSDSSLIAKAEAAEKDVERLNTVEDIEPFLREKTLIMTTPEVYLALALKFQRLRKKP